MKLYVKRVYDFDIRQIIVGVFLFVTLVIFISVTIIGFGNMMEQHPLDTYARITILFWIYASIPFCIYIAMFTRFNNPFRVKPSKREVM